MATNDLTTGDRAVQTPPTRTRVFTVRLWKEELAGGSEFRGSVRDVMSNACRGFQAWSDLVAFMAARLEQEERDVDH